MLKLCKHFNPHSRVGNDARLSHGVQSISSDFNPRSRVGNDADLSVLRLADAISIHVPAWGTTGQYVKISCDIAISIHVPAWGTTINRRTLFDEMIFQSTFPRGERQRSRRKIFLHVDISIHVPAWGTTTLRSPLPRLIRFQSTFPRGERRTGID